MTMVLAWRRSRLWKYRSVPLLMVNIVLYPLSQGKRKPVRGKLTGLLVLVIDDGELKEGLRMLADGAKLRGVFPDDDMPAVAAFPDREVVADEHDAAFDFLKKRAITFFVMLFDLSDEAELRGDFFEAFLLGDFGEARIHIGPFVVFAIGSGFEIL